MGAIIFPGRAANVVVTATRWCAYIPTVYASPALAANANGAGLAVQPFQEAGGFCGVIIFFALAIASP
jgi:hypothetical protein